jgi:hypothetical protein
MERMKSVLPLLSARARHHRNDELDELLDGRHHVLNARRDDDSHWLPANLPPPLHDDGVSCDACYFFLKLVKVGQMMMDSSFLRSRKLLLERFKK